MRHWIGRSTSTSAAGLAGLVLVACASQVAPFTPEPVPSVAADEARDAAEVVDAFLALMADPEVTYRVESEVGMGVDGQGDPAITLRGRYDVAADAYAGQASGTGAIPERAASNVFVVAFEDETHVWESGLDTWTSVDSAAVGHRPNALADLEAHDMVFIGRTTEGLIEFDVRRWLFDDPIGSWAALRGFGDAEVPATSTGSHRTRLLLDANGAPSALRSSWTFSTEGESAVALGSLAHQFSAFGLYVSIPEDFEKAPFGTSHDVVVGVDDANGIIREPWFDVGPPPDESSAAIEVSAKYTGDEPMMLGIEGAIFFLSSHDLDGALVLDATVPFEGGGVRAPVGQQALSAYYRTCDGNCSVLGPPSPFCTTDASLEAGARYELAVVVTRARPLAADCILTANRVSSRVPRWSPVLALR